MHLWVIGLDFDFAINEPRKTILQCKSLNMLNSHSNIICQIQKSQSRHDPCSQKGSNNFQKDQPEAEATIFRKIENKKGAYREGKSKPERRRKSV